MTEKTLFLISPAYWLPADDDHLRLVVDQDGSLGMGAVHLGDALEAREPR